MFSKLDVIAMRAKSLLAKTAIKAKQNGEDALDAMADKLDSILDQIPFALRETILRKINKISR